jgi:hypothetical protein
MARADHPAAARLSAAARSAVEGLERRWLFATAPVGAEFRVNGTIPGDQVLSDVASNARGDFVVVWQSDGQDGSGAGVYGRRYNAAGAAQGAEFRANTTTAGDQTGAAVAIDADGDFVVAWQSVAVDGTTSIVAQRFNAAGVRQGAEIAVNALHRSVDAVDVAMDADGDFLVAFGATDGPIFYQDANVFGRRYSAAGVAQGEEFEINETVDGAQTHPRVAMDAGGNAVVKWESNGQVHARQFTPGGDAQGPEIRVNTFSGGQQYGGDVVVVPGGAGPASGFVVTWNSDGQDGSGAGVYARRFDAAGAALGDEFQVSTRAEGDQTGGRAFAEPDGGFGIAWLDAPSNAAIVTRYDAAGAKTEDVLVTRPGIPAALPGDGFVNVATAMLQATNGFDVVAQRYETLAQAAGVGDFVWDDANANGVQDAGEAGRDGIVVNLFTATGTPVGTGMTAAGGRYRFDNLRPGSTYVLEFIVPAGLLFATRDQGADDARDSDADVNSGRTAPFVAGAAGSFDTTRDAGLVASASVSGALFNDRDGNGTRGAGEEGLAGWTVFVDANANGGLDSDESRASTDASGAYALAGLRPGPQTVRVVLQDRWTQTAPPGGAGQALTLSPGQSVTGADFAVHTDTPDLQASPAGTEFRASPTSPAGQNLADIAAADDGSFVVVWQNENQDGSSWGVFGRRFTAAGDPVGPEFRVNERTAGAQGVPSVAVDADGDFVVAWQNLQQDGSSYDIYTRRFDAAGDPRGGEFLVNQTTAGSQTNASVATDAGGDFVIAWVGESSGQVFARRFGAAGNALTDEFRVDALEGASVHEPSAAMDADGDFVVAWGSADFAGSGAYDVYARRYTAAGAALGDPFVVHGQNPDTQQRHPSVAMDDAGDFVVAFERRQSYDVDVYARRFNAVGVAQGDEFRVNEAPAFQQTSPDVSLDAAGDFVVTWQSDQQDGSAPDVYGRRYNAAGVPTGGEFRANTTTAGAQANPAVAVAGSGDFVIAWEDRSAPAGIFAQRYIVPHPVLVPHVTRVYVSGVAWGQAFLTYLGTTGAGSDRFGYAVPDDSVAHVPERPPQLEPLPWAGMDRITIEFDRDVNVDQDDLRVSGVNVAGYDVVAFTYDPSTKTATWGLAPGGVANDRITLRLDAGGVTAAGTGGTALDGEWGAGAVAMFPSGNGAPGGDFVYRLNDLAGDVTRDASVNAVDLSGVKRRLNRTTQSPGEGNSAYSIFTDVTGDGRINALDISAVKLRLNRRLPVQPAAPAGETAAVASVPTVADELFGTTPILA